MSAIRMIGPADVPAIMVLKDAAGWNQTGQDWLNLMQVAPDSCFGIEADGRMAATTTVVCYGRELAWIGMVLTHPECRGRGYARQLMEHALDYTERMHVRTVKLDATDMGYPLYAKLGFVDECAIERWGRPAGDPALGKVEFLPAPFPAELDRRAFGTDRSAYLELLQAGEWTAAPEAYAMSRPGTRAHYFGPCVSGRPEIARELLRWCLSRHGTQPVYWDLLPGNQAAAALAAEYGFKPLRRLVRMVLGDRSFPHDDLLVYATAGFEVG